MDSRVYFALKYLLPRCIAAKYLDDICVDIEDVDDIRRWYSADVS